MEEAPGAALEVGSDLDLGSSHSYTPAPAEVDGHEARADHTHDRPPEECPFGSASALVCNGSATTPSDASIGTTVHGPGKAFVLAEPDDSLSLLLSLKFYRPPRS